MMGLYWAVFECSVVDSPFERKRQTRYRWQYYLAEAVAAFGAAVAVGVVAVLAAAVAAAAMEHAKG